MTYKEKAKWKAISSDKLDIEFIAKNKEYLDFKLVCKNSLITVYDINKYKLKDYIDWTNFVLYQTVEPEFIWNNCRKVDWTKVSAAPELNAFMMDNYGGYLNWSIVTGKHKFSEEILLQFKDKIDWKQACISQKLSMEFIDNNFNMLKPYLYEVCKYQKLTEKFIRNHKNELDWNTISEYQKLSERFILEMSDYVNWVWISEKQKLSKEFILQNKDKLIMTRIFCRKKISLPKEIKNSEYFKIYKIYSKALEVG